MKKNLLKTFALLLVMALFALMAMGSGSDTSETKTLAADSQTQAAGTTKETAAEEETEAETTAAAAAEAVTIEELVLFEQDGIRVTAKAYEVDSIWGDGIKLLLENEGEKNVTVSCDTLIVNNYNISDLFAEEVAAGKKANATVNLSTSALEAAGIDTVGQIEMKFRVYDTDTWEDYFTTDMITVKTSAFDRMDTKPNDDGKELFNENGIRIIGKYVDEDSFWGAGILLFLENKTEQNITVSAENLSVNGFMLTPYFSCEISAGKMAINDITLMSSELEENEIESIDEVELTFHIYDTDTYDTIVDTDPIAFTTK